MKKLLVILATLALIAGMGVMKAEAAPTADIAVTVTVQNIGVIVADGGIAFGTVIPANTTVGEKQVVTNTGNINQTYTIQMTTTDVYTVGITETAAGADTFVLQALFVGSGSTTPGASEFGADTGNDDVVLSSAATAASSTVYAWSGGGGTGASVPAGAARDLYLQYSAPTSVTTAAEENLVVRITATAG